MDPFVELDSILFALFERIKSNKNQHGFIDPIVSPFPNQVLKHLSSTLLRVVKKIVLHSRSTLITIAL